MVTQTARLAMVIASLWLGFGVGGGAQAGPVLATPAGLSPGQSFRFVFVTDRTTSALSSNIADYNNFVNADAGGAMSQGIHITWNAIGSTSSVAAIDNVGQTDTPVYRVDGALVARDTTRGPQGLWSLAILNPINLDILGRHPSPRKRTKY